MARGSSEYYGQRRATRAIPVQAVMQRQYCVFTAFAVALNKPDRGFSWLILFSLQSKKYLKSLDC